VVVTALAAALAIAGAGHPCRAALPDGPVVPAPVVLRNSCGAFRLAPDGEVTRLPRHWFARRAGGTGRRYGADVAVRRTRPGRFILLRHGHVVWRSSGLYRNDGGSVAFGPHLFAFATYRQGVFLTDLKSPERLVMRARGPFPYEFTRRGELLVIASRAVTVLSRPGAVLRRYRYRGHNGFTFDGKTETLYFVTRDGKLVSARGARLQVIGPLRGVDGWVTFAAPRLLVFTARRSIAVTRLDGTLVARTRWPRSRVDMLDAGVSVAPGGRSFAFRLSNGRPGSRRARAGLYVFRAGDTRSHLLYGHHLGPSGCAVGANLNWHGPYLLYSSFDRQRAIVDTRSGHLVDLRPLARALPRRSRNELADAFGCRVAHVSAFDDLGSISPHRIWDGLAARVVEGERMSMIVAELDAGTVVPEHSHDHEQMGVLVSGSLTFRIGDEERVLEAGGTWCVPSGVPHSVTTGPDGAVLVEVFAPTRADWAAVERLQPRAPRWPG
jgi:quercetin dioxygenase-like cupin family protein